MTWWQRNRAVVSVLIAITPANIAWMWPLWWLGLVITAITAAVMFWLDWLITH